MMRIPRFKPHSIFDAIVLVAVGFAFVLIRVALPWFVSWVPVVYFVVVFGLAIMGSIQHHDERLGFLWGYGLMALAVLFQPFIPYEGMDWWSWGAVAFLTSLLWGFGLYVSGEEDRRN